MRDLLRHVAVREAIVPIYATTGHATTATEVNATGWSRAMWIINVGAMDAAAVVEMEVQNATATAGTFADVTSAALTDIASAGASKIYVIQHAVAPTKPFLKLAGTCGTARAIVSAVCILFGRNGVVRDPYSDAGQVVEV